MNKLWQQLAIATNWPVLAAVAVLSALGLVSVWADSPADGQKQLAFLGVGLACMLAFQAVNYQIIGRFAWGFYVLALMLVSYTVLGAAIGGTSPIPLVRRVNVLVYLNEGWQEGWGVGTSTTPCFASGGSAKFHRLFSEGRPTFVLFRTETGWCARMVGVPLEVHDSAPWKVFNTLRHAYTRYLQQQAGTKIPEVVPGDVKLCAGRAGADPTKPWPFPRATQRP